VSAERTIMHVDMDAFFAAVEQRDRPELRGVPVVVGADPKEGKGRGVVSTCSYEARTFGIHSAQPIREAYRRCPAAAFLPVRMDAYAEASRQIRGIFEEFTPDVEPVSIDEAFLDVTRSCHLFGGKRPLAEQLQARVEERTRLTASLGVAPCKMVAKIASDLRKPRGLVVVEPTQVEAFLRPLAVGRLWGVGTRTREALEGMGIRTIGDLAASDPAELARRFGKHGEALADLAHGRDQRPVEVPDETKSIGNEHTFERDTADPRLIAATLMELCENVAYRLRHAALRGRTVTTKVRLDDFTTLTRATTLERPVATATRLYQVAQENFRRAPARGHDIRLVGVSVSSFTPRARQLSLFDDSQARRSRERRQQRLDEAIDRIKDRFGRTALRQGTSLDRPAEDDETH